MGLRSLYDLEVAHCCQLHCQVGQSVGGAVDDKHVQDDIIVVHCDRCLCIDWVRVSCELVHMPQLGSVSVEDFEYLK